ncbi:MAG: bifunctional molybdenum cofactor biosynthesis protein MoaC/MoaB [Bacteroidota bacterium]
MRDIHHKHHTLRIALAEAVLRVRPESVDVVRHNTGPKQDILPTARAAGYLAVKNTPGAIPLCHPLPVEAVDIDFEFSRAEDHGEIRILLLAKTIYKTGCEVEAMHGAAVVALTIYDMLKPVDSEIEIEKVRLVRKQGGKTDFGGQFDGTLTAAVIVCSDSVAAGNKEDKAGKVVAAKLEGMGLNLAKYTVIPDEVDRIQSEVRDSHAAATDLILTCGGTGLSPTDVTPEAVRPLLDREVPGIMEAARDYGQQRTPYAMLSRGVAGLMGRSLVITVPGSTKGAEETIDALFPAALHIFKVLEHGFRHGK